MTPPRPRLRSRPSLRRAPIRTVRHLLRRLPAYDYRRLSLLLRLAFDLVRIDRSLKRHGYRATWDWTTRRDHPWAGAVRGLSPDAVADRVNIAARWSVGVKTTCLRRALLLGWILRSNAVACELVGGVGRLKGEWSGHAWIEIDGAPVGDDVDVGTGFPAFREQLSRPYAAGSPNANSPIAPASR